MRNHRGRFRRRLGCWRSRHRRRCLRRCRRWRDLGRLQGCCRTFDGRRHRGLGRLRFSPYGAGLVQNRDGTHHLRDDAGRGSRRRRDSGRRATGAAFFEHQNNGIALLRFQVAELILHVETGLAAKIEKIFTFDIELARQCVYTNFLLQSELPDRLSPPSPLEPIRKRGQTPSDRPLAPVFHRG